ncbi:retrovirus-related pol polyprotein from transposon TNT 1-94 [Tanacetum coccineum]
MSSMSEDIQCAGSDTRHQWLIEQTLNLGNNVYLAYCLGKDNGENIMKSINEGPFHMGTVSDVIARGTEGAVQQGPFIQTSLTFLTQSYKSHLPQTNNQLRTSSNARNKATVQDGRVVVQDVRGRYNANNQGKPFQRNNARGNVVAGNVGGQNRGGIINPGQAKPIKCYNCNGLGHIARECPRPKRLQDSDYFKDKMLLMQAQENGAVLDGRKSLFLQGEQVTNFDEDVDNSPENDLALNVDHVFEADECDAFDSIKNLEHQIQEKENVIRDLKVLVANVNDRSYVTYNAKDVTALIEENDCVRVEPEKVKQHYKELYNSIKIKRAYTRKWTSYHV